MRVLYNLESSFNFLLLNNYEPLHVQNTLHLSSRNSALFSMNLVILNRVEWITTEMVIN